MLVLVLSSGVKSVPCAPGKADVRLALERLRRASSRAFRDVRDVLSRTQCQDRLDDGVLLAKSCETADVHVVLSSATGVFLPIEHVARGQFMVVSYE